jgi:predicted ABC-type transport system involved in lysophospholipase L1 biosynthesis ATPase subunit
VLLDPGTASDVLQVPAQRIGGSPVHRVALAAAGQDEPEIRDQPTGGGDRLDETRQVLDRVEEAEEDGKA